MNISTKSRYGLRALADLAQHKSEGAVSISTISKRQNISTGYLEQLMSKLKRAGIVASTRGASGGYTLARPPEQITAGEILRALEGGEISVDCPGITGSCQAKCAALGLWRRINDGLAQIVDETPLSALIDDQTTKTGSQRGCKSSK